MKQLEIDKEKSINKLVVGDFKGIPAYFHKEQTKEVQDVMSKYFEPSDWYYTEVDVMFPTTPANKEQWYKELTHISGVVL